MNMRFEAREVKPYAEPLESSDLRLGEIYFHVVFFDDAMLVPVLEPLIFVGENLHQEHEEDGDRAYFQDVDSYQAGVRFDDSGPEEAEFQTFSSKNLGCIFDFDAALNVLLGCSLRRDARKGNDR
jgi:hypothetical protein